MGGLSLAQLDSLYGVGDVDFGDDPQAPTLADIELLAAVADGEAVEDWDQFRDALRAAVGELTAEEVIRG